MDPQKGLVAEQENYFHPGELSYIEGEEGGREEGKDCFSSFQNQITPRSPSHISQVFPPSLPPSLPQTLLASTK